MTAADLKSPVSPDEAAALFHDLERLPSVLLAVSGGPDSTALMWLTARWRAGLERGPKLIAATVDHGLRPEALAEARQVAKLARELGIPHRILRWTGRKPETGVQEAARAARYRLLAAAARRSRAAAIVTAHTLDDQAETVLFRLARGSGITGLAGMRAIAPLPTAERKGGTEAAARPDNQLSVLRPFLKLPKSRLIATLRAENIPFAEDPSNRDPGFTRARLRRLLPLLAEEGLDAPRLRLLAERLARADVALTEIAERTYKDLAKQEKSGRILLPAAAFLALPDEIRLRLLSRAISRLGEEGPVELGKLEALHTALSNASAYAGHARFRRSLAGALVTLGRGYLIVERAPPRRSLAFTKRRAPGRLPAKRR